MKAVNQKTESFQARLNKENQDIIDTANLSRLHGVRRKLSLRPHVPLSENEGESYFVAPKTCRSQGTKGACTCRPICFREGSRLRQPRHRARKEREG
jgi:hypothetical protein